MAVLYSRQITVTIAGLTIHDPRIAVEVERTMDEIQAKGRVDVYNLNPAHEQQIRERGDTIIVSAGYPQTQAEIFNGRAQRIVRAREQLARITRIHLGDEVRDVKREGGLGGKTNRSYDGPVAVRDIVQALIEEDLKLPHGPLDVIPLPATYTNYYWTGNSDAALSVILRAVDCEWFVSDGVVRINKTGATQADAPTITLSPEEGLIDSVIITDEGHEARMFLNPAVELGCIMAITSAKETGRYKVVGLRHKFDNWASQGSETWVDLRAL